jgi:hypothetical protein
VCGRVRLERVELRRHDDDDDDDDGGTVVWAWRLPDKTDELLLAKDPVAHSITVNLPVDDDALPFFHAARSAGRKRPKFETLVYVSTSTTVTSYNPNIHERVWILLTSSVVAVDYTKHNAPRIRAIGVF